MHKLRNVASKLPKKDAKRCFDGSKKIYLADVKQAAAAIYKSWVATYGDIYPKAVACLSKDIDEMLTFFDFPESVRVKIRIKNIIE